MGQTGLRFVVGLGNPGRKYHRTRHNLGFMLVEELARRWHAGAARRAFGGLLTDAQFGLARVMLLEPMTFMNRSGQAVGEMMRFYKARPSDVLIALDDLALPPGTIRLRSAGSAGGHNGLSDVLRVLGTQDVPRLRLGIGPTPTHMDGADYVLGRLTEEELAQANEAVEMGCNAVEDWVRDGIEKAMTRNN